MNLLTPAQVATMHGVNPETVRRALRAGDIPGALRVGPGWVVPESAAKAWERRKLGRPVESKQD